MLTLRRWKRNDSDEFKQKVKETFEFQGLNSDTPAIIGNFLEGYGLLKKIPGITTPDSWVGFPPLGNTPTVEEILRMLQDRVSYLEETMRNPSTGDMFNERVFTFDTDSDTYTVTGSYNAGNIYITFNSQKYGYSDANEGLFFKILPKVIDSITYMFSDIEYNTISFIPAEGSSSKGKNLRLKGYNIFAKRLFGQFSLVAQDENTTLIPIPEMFKNKVHFNKNMYQKDRASSKNSKTTSEVFEQPSNPPTGKKIPLFPESETVATQEGKPENKFKDLLQELSSRFNIPYEVIDDPRQRFKGKYVNKGNNDRKVIINVAYATEDTPLHEYYHPFVSMLKISSPSIFDILYKESYSVNGIEDQEESVVTYLSKQALNNKLSLYLNLFLNQIKKFLGLRNNLSAASTLIDVLDMFNRGETVPDTVVRTAYQNLDEAEEAVAEGLGTKPPPRIDYIQELEKQAEGWTTSDTSVFYEKGGTEKAKRVTSHVGDVEVGEYSSRQRRFSNTDLEYETKKVFARNGVNVYEKSQDAITETITVDNKQLTFRDVYRIVEDNINQFKNKGKLVHAYLQYILENDPAKKEAARQSALKYAMATKADFTTLDNHPTVRRIRENLDAIFKEAGVIVDLKNEIPTALQDKVSSEGVIVSDQLVDKDGNRLATTYDGFFVHRNGEATLVDFKTGWITRDASTNQMMKYGEEFNINDSKLSRAYLELALRAVMLKEKFPDLKFRSIKIVSIDSLGNPTAMELDLEPYLFTIQNYYKQNHPKLYQELTDKGLFVLSSYKGTPQALIDLHDKIGHLTREEKLTYLKNQLAALYSRSSKEQVERDERKKKLSIQLTEAILEIEKEPSMDLKSKTPDIGAFWRFKNFSDIDNPRIHVLHKLLLTARDNITKVLNKISDEHDSLFLNLMNERVTPDQKITKAALKVLEIGQFAAMATWNPVIGAGITALHNTIISKTNMDTRDFYAFMWRKSDEIGGNGYYLNTKDTYVKDGKEVPMTKAEKEYRNFIHQKMKAEYNKFAMEVVSFDPITRNPIYRYMTLAIPPEMPINFLPRIPKTESEVREEEIKEKGFQAGVAGLTTTTKESTRRLLTGFLEDKYGRGSEGVPFRYFKHTDSPGIVDAENHSFNVHMAFKMFMTSMVTKAEMDPMYNLARGVRNALDEEILETGEERRYPNTVQWLDEIIYPQILGRQKTEKVLSRAVRWKAGKTTEFLTGIQAGTDVRISELELVKSLKSLVTAVTLGFKVVSPLRNGIYVLTQSLSQSTKLGITKLLGKIYGVEVDELSQVDFAGGKVLLQDYIGKALTGNEESSKLWALAKTLRWLPDNYAITQEDIKKMEAVPKLGMWDNMYAVYAIGENLGALWHLAGLLKATKIQDKDGNKVSLWDAYNDKGEWVLGTRGVITNSDGTTTELKELTSLEVKALKRTHERISGSYRREEKIALEANVWGDFTAQFQKHAFQYVKVLFGSKYRDRSIGKYVMTGKKPDGMPMYEWHSEIIQGQMKIFIASMFAAISGKHKEYMLDSGMSEATLKYSRIRAMSSLLNTFIWWVALLAIYNWAFDDEEEKTPVGRSVGRIVHDMSRFLSLKDILDATDKPVVSLDVFNRLGKSTWVLLSEGLVEGKVDKNGVIRGASGLAKLIPGYSSRSQIEQILGNDENPRFLYGIVPIETFK